MHNAIQTLKQTQMHVIVLDKFSHLNFCILFWKCIHMDHYIKITIDEYSVLIFAW